MRMLSGRALAFIHCGNWGGWNGLNGAGGLCHLTASRQVSFVLIKSDESVAADAFCALHFSAYVSVAKWSSSRLIHSLLEPWAWHLFNLGFQRLPYTWDGTFKALSISRISCILV